MGLCPRFSSYPRFDVTLLRLQQESLKNTDTAPFSLWFRAESL